MAMRVWEREKKRRLPCNRADRGCVALLGQHRLAGNGANFSPVLTLETVYGTDVGSKANDDGASRWCSFRHVRWIVSIDVRVGRKPVSSRSCLFLTKAASSFAKGGVVECSSRVRRKSHARFLEGWARVTVPGYSTGGKAKHYQTVRTIARSLRGWSGAATNRSKPSDNVPIPARVASEPRGDGASTEANAGLSGYGADFGEEIHFREDAFILLDGCTGPVLLRKCTPSLEPYRIKCP
jgi:hypothetical protein